MKTNRLVCKELFVAILLLFSSVIFAQTSVKVVVSGAVLDSANKPMGGVAVSINNKSITVTNLEGKFSVNVEKGSKLLFTSVGYVSAQYTASNAVSNISIKLLQSAANVLDDVVVTALGISRKERSLGYSVTSIQGEQLTDAKSANWSDALSGKVAGLNMIRSGSGPTGSNKIIIRGENNLTGDNEALIVVDGVVINQGSGRRTAVSGETVYGTGSDNMPADYGSSVNDINPEDIESVTVLKGPGAAALYGQRGANGAIIITTKSGSSKRKGLGVTYSANASLEIINRWPDLQNEYGQGLAGAPYYSYGASADGASTSSTSSAYGPRFNGQSVSYGFYFTVFRVLF